MIDFGLGVVAALSALRGYQRGVRPELTALVALVLAALVSLRLAGPLGGILESWAGVSSLAGRFLALVIVFAALLSGAAWLSARAFTREVATERLDQLGGTGLAVVWLTALASVAFYFLAALPLDEFADEALSGSRIVELLIGPDSVARRVVNAAAGDRVLEALVNLDTLVGDRQVVLEGNDSVALPASNDVLAVPDDARAVFDLLNLARIEANVAPLAFSDGLAATAERHALEMYEDGYFSHVSPETGTVADRVTAADIPFVIVGENLALAPTPATVHEGLLASPGHRSNMVESRYRRVGVAAVSGPLGLMVVQVFSG